MHISHPSAVHDTQTYSGLSWFLPLLPQSSIQQFNCLPRLQHLLTVDAHRHRPLLYPMSRLDADDLNTTVFMPTVSTGRRERVPSDLWSLERAPSISDTLLGQQSESDTLKRATRMKRSCQSSSRHPWPSHLALVISTPTPTSLEFVRVGRLLSRGLTQLFPLITGCTQTVCTLVNLEGSGLTVTLNSCYARACNHITTPTSWYLN